MATASRNPSEKRWHSQGGSRPTSSSRTQGGRTFFASALRLDDNHCHGSRVPSMSVLSGAKGRSLKTLRTGSQHNNRGNRRSAVPLHGNSSALVYSCLSGCFSKLLWV